MVMRMRNLLVVCLGIIIITGVMAGCSNEAASPKKEVESQTKAKDTSEPQTSEDQEVDEEEKSEAEESTAMAADVGNAIDYTEALDPKKPIPFGTYMKTTIYSTEDKKYHPVYVKLNKITSESDNSEYIQKALDENNEEGNEYDAIHKEDLDLPDDVELNIIDYEVMVPKEFPASEFGGVTGINISFTADNIEGGGIPSNNGGSVYLALGAADKLLSPGDRETTFMPGSTYPLRAYYRMVKGYDDYLLEINAFPEGSDGQSDMKTAYFAIK